MADFHSLLLQASFSHQVLVMLNAFRSRFSTSRNFGRPIGQGALGSSLYIGLPYFCDFKAGRLQRPRPLSCDFLTLHFPILLHRHTFKAIPAVFIDRIVIESSCAYSLSKYRFQFEK